MLTPPPSVMLNPCARSSRADQRAIFVGRVGIPACRRGNVGGQRGGVAAVDAAGAHAVCRVAHVDAGNAEPRNADCVTHAAIRRRVLRRYRIVGRHADAVQQCDLFVERHFLDHQVGALVGREAGSSTGQWVWMAADAAAQNNAGAMQAQTTSATLPELLMPASETVASYFPLDKTFLLGRTILSINGQTVRRPCSEAKALRRVGSAAAGQVRL